MLNSSTHAVRGLFLIAFLLLSGTVLSQGSVSGRCTDKNGAPLKGVQITAVQFDDRHTMETDADGFYQDKQLAPGEWMMIFVHNKQRIVRKIMIKNAQTAVDLDMVFIADEQ